MSDLSTEPPSLDRADLSRPAARARPDRHLLTGSRAVAEDLVQTDFAAAQARWAHIDDPLAYLRQVIVNQANQTHRRRYRRPPDIDEPVTHR